MAVVKKKAAKKKTATKKTANRKSFDNLHLESKLGHDPLAWISGNDDVVSNSNIVVEPDVVTQPVVEVIVHDVVESVSEEPQHESDVQAEVEIVRDEEIADFNDEKDKSMLHLPDVFGIAQAEVVYDEISKMLVSEDDIKIDASLVETVDASALQLLMSLIKEARAQGKAISWHAKSSKINDSAKLLNVTEFLAL